MDFKDESVSGIAFDNENELNKSGQINALVDTTIEPCVESEYSI